MKQLLFAAAVVLLYTQVLQASSSSTVHFSSASGGSKIVTTESHITTTNQITTDSKTIGARGKDDNNDNKGCSHSAGHAAGNVQITETFSSSKSGKNDDHDNGKSIQTTATVAKSSTTSGKTEAQGKGDDKGCSQNKDHSRGDDDDDDDKKKSHVEFHFGGDKVDENVKVINANSGVHSTATITKSSTTSANIGAHGKDDDDDDKRKNHVDWNFGKNDDNNDDDNRKGHVELHFGYDKNDENVKVINGHSDIHSTTSIVKSTASSEKIGSHGKDDDDERNNHLEWHFGNVDKIDEKKNHVEWHIGTEKNEEHVKVINVPAEHHTTTTIVVKSDGQEHACGSYIKLLEEANAQIKLLVQKSTSWALQEVEYNAQIFALKTNLQKSTDNYRILETTVNGITAQLQSWKSQYDVISITLKQVQEINIKLEFNLKTTQTTVNTLQQNIEEIKTTTKNNDKELIEWKHKYEILWSDSESYKKQVKDITISNNDLKKSNAELTEKLTRSVNDGHQLSTESITLKSTIESNKQTLAACELEKTKLFNSLQIEIKDYDENQLKYHNEITLRTKTDADLSHCRTQYTEIENNSKLITNNLLSCKNEIAVIRENVANTSKKYENDIQNIQISLDEYKALLKTEIDLKNTFVIQIKNYELHIEDVEYQLNLSRKATIDAQSQTKNCQDGISNFEVNIASLKQTISDTATQLATCGDHSHSIQFELTASQSRILQLEQEKNLLGTGKSSCETELSTLRCETSKYLASDQQSDSTTYEKVLAAVAIYDGTKVAIKKFVDSQNIRCTKA